MTLIGETSTLVLESWDEAVRSDPGAMAVTDGKTRLSRAELSRRSAQLAAELAARGVGRGDRVGVCVERSAALIVAVLGVVRAGAAYVAIDPAYPGGRIAWMLQDSGAAAVVVSAGGTPVSESGAVTRLVLTSDGLVSEPLGVLGDDAVASPASDTEPAYVVYTSGSTGRPKGVVIDHGGLRNLVAWHCAAFGLEETDMSTQIASPGFDAAAWEIWPALAVGAGLHIAPESLRTDPLGLRDWLVRQRITVGFVPTALAEGLITLEWPEATALRFMLAGGDALTRRPRADLPFTLVNNYGVSEAAVVATSGPVTATGDGPPSIGRPITGVLAEIVDAAGQPVADGSDGELVLGGPAVGQGYVNQPELTAERFYEDARGRWYRTGDRMRLTETGELTFAGRLDDQLSIRGFRVEPGDIAHALNAHPDVTASTAIGVGASSAERRLVAYVVATGDARPTDDDLTAFLASRLPAHMLPSAYMWLEALPLTAHGKIDRSALPEAVGVAESNAGMGVEATITASIAELLGVPTVGPTENFFLLGGHSLLAAQLIIRLAELYDVEMSLRFLFDHPTASELTVEVQRLQDEEDER